MLSPILMPSRPHSLPIRPADSRPSRASEPRSKTRTAVTLPSLPSPKVTRSRVRRAPENIRAYATRSPARPRSTLNTVPETCPSVSPRPAGSRSLMPAISSSTPAPVMAEPKNTGCTRACLVWSASAARSRPSGTPPWTYAVSSRSSWSASTSSASGVSPGTKCASGVPCPAIRPIATTAGVRRSVTARSTASSRAPRRSILLTKTSVGTRSRRSVRIRTRVCAWTPSTAETTSTAPSSTLSTRSTSAMKSGWPGVSIRLTVTSSISNETTADLMVIPRCRSSASESVWVLPSSTLPISSMIPTVCSSRSVRLVLPASTCARIPRFSVCTACHVL